MRAETRPLATPAAGIPACALARPLPAAPPQDTLGCSAGALHNDQELSANGVRVYRKTVDTQQRQHVETDASGRGVLVGISLRDGHRRKVLHEHHAECHDFGKGAVYIRDFCDRYRADMQTGFDFVLLEISHAALQRAFDDKQGARVGGIAPATAVRDDVLAHLAGALTPALQRPSEASMLFVDQVCLAMTSYLVDAHGQAAPAAEPRTHRVLSRSHEARAKEMLRSKMDGGISIAEIADACNLSRSYFIHAFRETTGQTPHQWLVAQRLERAQALLMDFERPLAEVAAACGFSDQSHFTRVFSQFTGTPPGTWRRKMRVDK
ncbi:MULTISPECIES: AraC family transcriptional regulator [unclassified Variovorax]|jgi:AraC family transcriptional regulator|uniref:helix-turn-helix domain-containing protein n=1 Tax=unclassified Variovorax TaxID=663243 RepID=UPI0008CB854F|nr:MULTISPECIES: AraC family transcriptional regulator [unclassified Variovorax]SEK12647.1 AraC-type DNA-binding protein [Variovorax sp. OK202]SFD82725.1 AraC-type DNA-binding protein [Variovorax sp. OK212]